MGTTAFSDVELVTVGTHAASTGATTVNQDDFDSMVRAYQDHVVDRPIVKLGHEDDNPMNAALADGEPAYGWIERVGVGDGTQARPNRNSLYGDLVGIPAKLAEVIPTAFRRRSVEIAWGVKTVGGKTYAAVLEAVALLGAKKPAVKGLGDLLALYSDGQILAVESQTAVLVEEKRDTPSIRPRSRLAGDGDDVETATNDTTIKEPTMAKLNKAEYDKAVAEGPEAVQAYLTKAGVEFDDTTVAKDEADETEDGQKVIPITTAEPKVEKTDPIVETATKTAASEKVEDMPETVTVTKATFSELQSDAKLGKVAHDEIVKTRRDGLVKTAFSEGRITRTERKKWREALDKDEALATSLLSEITPRFSTVEFGDDAARETEFTEHDKSAWDDFMSDLKSLA